MIRIIKYLAIFTLIAMLSIAGVHASGKPSAGAEGMAGAMGTFDFKPQDWMEGTTSWWKDSDGISPGVAGCHIGTDAEGKPNGRMFGEACLPDGLLVEVVELPGHPFFLASQFHPEFKSRPDDPHPMFLGFIEAALEHRAKRLKPAPATAEPARAELP